MAGMDEGPGTDLGSLGFYVSVWVAMMAAMMLPVGRADGRVHSASSGAARARSSRPSGRDRGFRRRLLLVWTAFGLVAYGVFELLRSLDVDALAWEPRRPLGGGRRDRGRGDVPADAAQGRLPREVPQPARFRHRILADRAARRARMGIEHGAWCVGCCWALMARCSRSA